MEDGSLSSCGRRTSLTPMVIDLSLEALPAHMKQE